LLGRVAGSPQPPTIQVGSRAWQLVSYHPHNGGVLSREQGSARVSHYFDEILCWIQSGEQ